MPARTAGWPNRDFQPDQRMTRPHTFSPKPVHRHTRLFVQRLEARDVPATYDLGVAADFNAFFFDRMNAFTSDVEGRVAVGGDATFYAYGIGDRLENSHGQRVDLIVGNDLTYTYGQVFYGNIVYGNGAALTGVGIPNGDERQEAGVVDFTAAADALSEMSAVLGEEAPNGGTRFSRGNLNLRGTNLQLDIFTITPEQLAAAHSIYVLTPAGSTVVINVPGDSVSVQNLGLHLRGVDCARLLWNFYEAEELTISGVGLQGSILAPDAALSFNNGQIRGTVIAQSMTGNGQFNLCPSEIQITIPERATLQGLVFVDVDGDNRRGDPAIEEGFDGADVFLTGFDSLGRRINRPYFTQDGGQFNFGDLWPGVYAVRVVPPQKYENSQQLGIPGTVDSVPIGIGVVNQVRSIILGEGQDGIDYLLPLLPTPD
jgi:choice-of-anchor A domain-containing protein